MALPDYYKTDDIEYEFDKRFRRETFDRTSQFREELEPEIRTVEVIKKRTIPRMEEVKIKPLNRDTPKVFGNLFDRVEFLEARMKETQNTISERKVLNNGFMEEINADIAEKEDMANHITDLDEKRNFKLDISILRKERRNENVQFWRDILELKTELRELIEKLQTEEKIVDVFKSMGDEDGL